MEGIINEEFIESIRHFLPKGTKSARIQAISNLKTKKLGRCSVSVPNPVSAYLAVAIKDYKKLIKIKQKMFEKRWRNKGRQYSDLNQSAFDQFFQLTVSVTTFSQMALEGWCNQVIPKDFIYTHRKKELNKIEIQRWVGLDDKLLKILPEIFSKPNFSGSRLWQRYKEVSQLRNEFIHLKMPAKTNKGTTNYDLFFEHVLNLHIEEVISLTIEIMQYFTGEKSPMVKVLFDISPQKKFP